MSRVLHRLKLVVTAIGMRVPFVMRFARALLVATRLYRYRRIAAHQAVVANEWVFEAYGGRSYSCSPRAIYEAMLRDPRFEDAALTWAFQSQIAAALAARGYEVQGLGETVASDDAAAIDLDMSLGARALSDLRRATIVVCGSREYFTAFARAGTWVTNSLLPEELFPRDGQTYLQTWHGTPLKRLGREIPAGGYATIALDALWRLYKAEGERLTYLVSPSHYTTERLSAAFGLSSEKVERAVLEEGYPRNDFFSSFTDEDVNEVKRRLGLPDDKQVILYAPTWRDDQYQLGTGYILQPQIDWTLLERELKNDYVVLVRTHWFIANQLNLGSSSGFWFDASVLNDINDALIVSQLLVTDYSSVFFDYANLGRPIIFYMYDLERYADDVRGLYLGLDELPGPVVRSELELVAAVRDGDALSTEMAERRSHFDERYTRLDDGHAGQRVLERIVRHRGRR